MKPYYETILNHIKPPFSILFQRFTDQTACSRPPPPVVPRVLQLTEARDRLDRSRRGLGNMVGTSTSH